MKCLLVRHPWAGFLVEGLKTYEIRGRKTNIRGTIGIIETKTHLLLGTVDIKDCIQLDDNMFYRTRNKHLIQADRCQIKYEKLYAWEMVNSHKILQPIEINVPKGCVVWVNVDIKKEIA